MCGRESYRKKTIRSKGKERERQRHTNSQTDRYTGRKREIVCVCEFVLKKREIRTRDKGR